MTIKTAGLLMGSCRFRRSLTAVLLALGLPAGAAADNGWPDKVTARYKVSFNGFDIGSFRFESSTDKQTYSLAGSAKLSLLLGAYKWSGATSSKGVLAGDEPKPSEHVFEYKGGSKSGSVVMTFSKGRVAKATVVPPRSSSKKTVPLSDQHLEGVLDPLSAVMAMSRGQVDDPCKQKIGIFDGKQRFDLELSFSRRERIKEARPSGEPALGYVCRVRYVPIAGHKMNKMVASMAANKGIEVILRPIPSANILVPYQVRVPTFLGSAVLTSQRVEITTGMRQIALVY